MPFPDELTNGVVVVPSRAEWASDFGVLAGLLGAALGPVAVAIDHVGSTAVPGLPAKDCIDVQIRVDAVDASQIVPLFAGIGFRCRPESWNRLEVSSGQECRKLVFAPPVGARSCNVQVRQREEPNARYALLFRDFLRADEHSRRTWGAFKQRLAQSVPELAAYGQIKAPATEILMTAAERWAVDTAWSSSTATAVRR
jgi:dephospho-CoA kinase